MANLRPDKNLSLPSGQGPAGSGQGPEVEYARKNFDTSNWTENDWRRNYMDFYNRPDTPRPVEWGGFRNEDERPPWLGGQPRSRQPREYVVREGDSWASIAGDVYGDQRMFADLITGNPSAAYGQLQPGQKIRLVDKKDRPAIAEHGYTDSDGVYHPSVWELAKAGAYGGQPAPAPAGQYGWAPSQFQSPDRQEESAAAAGVFYSPGGSQTQYGGESGLVQGGNGQWLFNGRPYLDLQQLDQLKAADPQLFRAYQTGGLAGVNTYLEKQATAASFEGGSAFGLPLVDQRTGEVIDLNKPPWEQKTLRGQWGQFLGSPAGKATLIGLSILPETAEGLAAGGVGAVPAAAGSALFGGALVWASEKFFEMAQSDDPVVKTFGQLGTWAVTDALDTPRRTFEQALGTLFQIKGSVYEPEKYGSLEHVLGNLGAAWEAAKITYDSAPLDLKTPTDLASLEDWKTTALQTSPGQWWNAVQGFESPVFVDYDMPTANGGLSAVIEARERIAKGEDPAVVNAEIAARFGAPGALRELASGFLLDPLNYIGFIPASWLKAIAPQSATTLRAATEAGHFAEGWGGILRGVDAKLNYTRLVELPQVYRNQLVHTAITDAKQLNLIQRSLVGAEILSIIEDKPYKREWWELIGKPEPESATREQLNQWNDYMQAYVFSKAETPEDAARLLKEFAEADPSKATAGTAAEKAALTLQGQVIQKMVRNGGPVWDDVLGAWARTADDRAAFESLANTIGKTVPEVMADFVNGRGQYVLDAFGKAGGALDAKYSLAYLADGAKMFTKDGVPYTADMAQAAMYAGILESAADFNIKHFKIKPGNFTERLAATVKSAQSIVLLGGSPTYLINNFLNGSAMMLIHGIAGVQSVKEIADNFAALGLVPSRMAESFAKAEFGTGQAQQLSGLLGDIAKNFESVTGTAISEAKGMDAGALGRIRGWANKVNGVMPFMQLASRLEQWQGANAMWQGFRQAWTRTWRRGAAIEMMPAELEAALRTIDPRLPDHIYAAAEVGLRPQDIGKAIFEAAPAPTVERFIGSVFGERAGEVTDLLGGLKGTDGQPLLKALGVRILAKDYTPGNVRRAFVETLADAEVAAAKHFAAEAETTRGFIGQLAGDNEMGVVDAGALLMTFDDSREMLLRTFTEHKRLLRDFWEAQIADRGRTNWRELEALGDRLYKDSYFVKEEASLKALAAGMRKAGAPLDDGFLAAKQKEYKLTADFFERKQKTIREFFDLLPSERTREKWLAIQDRLDVQYEQLTKTTETLRAKMDAYLVKAFEKRFPGSGPKIEAWRKLTREHDAAYTQANRDQFAATRELRTLKQRNESWAKWTEAMTKQRAEWFAEENRLRRAIWEDVPGQGAVQAGVKHARREMSADIAGDVVATSATVGDSFRKTVELDLAAQDLRRASYGGLTVEAEELLRRFDAGEPVPDTLTAEMLKALDENGIFVPAERLNTAAETLGFVEQLRARAVATEGAPRVEPTYATGTRVTLPDGRRGEIVANEMGGPVTAYHVRTDNGAERLVTEADITLEQEQPGRAVPDPIIDRRSVEPADVLRELEHLERQAQQWETKANRARKPENKDRYLLQAAEAREKLTRWEKGWGDWASANVEAASSARASWDAGKVDQAARVESLKQAIKTSRGDLAPEISDLLLYVARQLKDDVLSGEPGKKFIDSDPNGPGQLITYSKSTYAPWYGAFLEEFKANKDTVLKALEKIIKDHGLDRGVMVERLKRLGLEMLADGVAGNPPEPSAMALLGKSQAEIDAAGRAWADMLARDPNRLTTVADVFDGDVVELGGQRFTAFVDYESGRAVLTNEGGTIELSNDDLGKMNLQLVDRTPPEMLRDKQLPLWGDEGPLSQDDILTLAKTEGAYGHTGQAYDEATTRARGEAIAAADGLRRPGIRILGNAISREFRDRGIVSLIGQEARSPADLATLAQVFRNPKFETARYFFMRGDEIVGELGVSARIPGVSGIMPTGKNAMKVEEIPEMMNALEADGFYVLHNHPSGSTQPSDADIVVTREDFSPLPGFRGHVIINHKQYAFLAPAGGQDHYGVIDRVPEYDVTNKAEYTVPHPLLGAFPTSPQGLADIAAEVASQPDWIVVMGFNSRGARGFMEVSPAELQDDLRAAAIIRRFALQTGANSMYLANVPVLEGSEGWQLRNRLTVAIQNDLIMDAVFADGKSMRMDYGNVQPLRDRSFGKLWKNTVQRVAEDAEQTAYGQGPLRNWRAGSVDGTVQFATELQAALFDLGASLRKKMRGGGERGISFTPADPEPRIEALVKATGLSSAELRSLAGYIYDDVRVQMKGMGEGETRKLIDNFTSQVDTWLSGKDTVQRTAAAEGWPADGTELKDGLKAGDVVDTAQGKLTIRNYESGQGWMATNEAGEIVRVPDQAAPLMAPPGFMAEQGAKPRPDAEAWQQVWYEQGRPALLELQEAMVKDAGLPALKGLGSDAARLDPDMMGMLNDWTRRTEDGMSQAKLLALKHAEWKRDAALLNYSRRYGLNTTLDPVAPYHFFTTASMAKWAMLAMQKPAVLANYYRMQKFFNEQVKRPGFPTRLAGKLRIPIPFMPEWMGGGIWVDPMRFGLPLDSYTQPWEDYTERQATLNNQVQRRLSDWVDSGKISASDYEAALAGRSDLAKQAEAEILAEDPSLRYDALDALTNFISPSLPLKWAYEVARGTPERIGPLPLTRTVKNLTGALGVGGPGGVNLEAGVRDYLDLPIYDQWTDYRVDRELSSMSAEGIITPKQAQAAMIEKQGAVYESAVQRITDQQTWGQLGLVLGQSGQFFTDGEQQQRAIKFLYNAAWEAKNKGDTQALNRFFDLYPEYSAQLALHDDPDERLNKFLVSQVWEAWEALPYLYREQLEQQFGPEFRDAFLSKETRNTAEISADTLATWARTLGKYVPLNVDGQALPIEYAPPQLAAQYQEYKLLYKQGFTDTVKALQDQYFDIPKENRISVAPAAVQTYLTTKREQFGDTGALWDQYFTLPKGGQRRQFLSEHPQMLQELDWKKAYLAEHPDVQAYIDSDAPFTISARTQFLNKNPALAEWWNLKGEWLDAHPEVRAYIDAKDSNEQMAGGHYEYAAGQMKFVPTGYTLGQDGSLQPTETKAAVQLEPMLERAVMAYAYAGYTLPAGARKQLQAMWKAEGSPGEFDSWLARLAAQLSQATLAPAPVAGGND